MLATTHVGQDGEVVAIPKQLAERQRQSRLTRSVTLRAHLTHFPGAHGSANACVVSRTRQTSQRTDGERPLVPVATLVVRQLSRRKFAGVVHVLVRMAMLLRAMGVGVAVVGVRVRVRCWRGRRAAEVEGCDGLGHSGHGQVVDGRRDAVHDQRRADASNGRARSGELGTAEKSAAGAPERQRKPIAGGSAGGNVELDSAAGAPGSASAAWAA